MRLVTRFWMLIVACLLFQGCAATSPTKAAASPSGQKHHLYCGQYEVLPGGVVKVPDKCGWKAVACDAADVKGSVLLLLAEPGFSPVMSYLTPEEATRVSEQLREAAQEASGHSGKSN